jgi:hypothetical protein
MRRLNLSILGNQVSQAKATCTFQIICCLTILFYVCNSTHVTVLPLNETRNLVVAFFYIVPSAIVFYTIFLIMRTRCVIRQKYRIPASCCCCGGCECIEDVTCTLLCPTLVISQMARHTADYDTYRAYCCSHTGLPDGAPTIV